MFNIKPTAFILVLASLLTSGAAFAVTDDEDLYGGDSPITPRAQPPVRAQYDQEDFGVNVFGNICLEQVDQGADYLLAGQGGNDVIYGDIHDFNNINYFHFNPEIQQQNPIALPLDDDLDEQ